MRYQWIRSAFIMAACATLVSLGIAAPAQANGTCSGINKNYFNGYYQTGHPEHPYEGASAYIVVRDGANCSSGSGSRFTTSWVMIASGNQSDSNSGYAQVGFDREVGDTLRWFSEFNDGHGTPVVDKFSTYSVTSEIGVRHTFRVLYVVSCACIKATIDSTNWASTVFNPYAKWGSQPWSPQFMTETTYLQSDVTGTAGARTAFTGVGAQRYVDDVVESMPCILNVVDDNTSRWSHSASSCTQFDLWTSNP